MNSMIVLGSLRASKACCWLNVLFSIPVWFEATRFTASTRSCSVKRPAVAGLSGRRKKMTKDQTQVAPPRMKKITSHRSGVMFAGILETPIAMYEPTIPPQPNAEYQMHCRSGISCLVYQKPVINVRPGVTAASNNPMINRTAIALEYVRHWVRISTITPQRKHAMPRTF